MKVQWICYLHPYTSMGVIAINVIKELNKLGIDAGLHVLNPQDIVLDQYPPEIQKAIQKEQDYDSIGIFFAYPDIYGNVRYKVNIGYTGSDSSRWYRSATDKTPAELCNSLMDYMLTPSFYSKNIMQNCGVTIPINVFPHGIDPELFKPKNKNNTNVYTFGYIGELSRRKGTQDLIESFSELFGNNSEFRLVLRANSHMKFYNGDQIKSLCERVNNIVLSWVDKGQEDLENYYNNFDSYIYPSKADWFGMTVLESLACGIPTIATANNGYYDFLSYYIYPISYKIEEIKNQHPYLLGDWFSVDKENLKSLMKMISSKTKYEYFKRISINESEEIRKNFSWEQVTKQYLLPFLEEVDKKHFKKEIDVKKIICGYP